MTDRMSASDIAITKVGDRSISLRQVNEMIFKRINAELEKNNNTPLRGLAYQYHKIVNRQAHMKVWFYNRFYENSKDEGQNPYLGGGPGTDSEILDAGKRLYDYYSTLTKENDRPYDGYVKAHKTPKKFNNLVTAILGDDAR